MFIIKMSIAASFYMLLVIGVRLLLANRLPKITFTILWWSAIIKLLIPLELPDEYKAMLKIESIQQVLPKEIMSNNVKNASDNFYLTTYSQIISFLKVLINNQLLQQIVWAGTLVISTFFIILLIRHLRLFSDAKSLHSSYLNNWLKQENLMRRIKIKTSTHITSPLTYGIIFPIIIIPEKMFKTYSKDELYLVLMHEITHIKHFDQLTKLALVFTACLHWFNPLVWVMLNLANQDIELACDETVLKRVSGIHKKLYSLILVNEAEKRLTSTYVENYFGKCFIEKRLIAVQKNKKAKSSEVVVASIIILIMFTSIIVGSNFKFFTDIQENRKDIVSSTDTLNSVISVEVFENKDSLYYDVNHNNVNYSVRGSKEMQLLHLDDDLNFNVTYSNIKGGSGSIEGNTHSIVFEKTYNTKVVE